MTIRGPVRLLILTLIAFALMLGVSAWMLGSKLVEPANHKVPMPAGFSAQSVAIPGLGHSVAGWWVDQGEGSAVVLLLHAVRADRSTMVSRAQLLMKHGFSVLLIDLQAHGEALMRWFWRRFTRGLLGPLKTGYGFALGSWRRC
jgi:uncharacterized protein